MDQHGSLLWWSLRRNYMDIKKSVSKAGEDLKKDVKKMEEGVKGVGHKVKKETKK